LRASALISGTALGWQGLFYRYNPVLVVWVSLPDTQLVGKVRYHPHVELAGSSPLGKELSGHHQCTLEIIEDLKLILVAPKTEQLLTQILHHSQYL